MRIRIVDGGSKRPIAEILEGDDVSWLGITEGFLDFGAVNPFVAVINTGAGSDDEAGHGREETWEKQPRRGICGTVWRRIVQKCARFPLLGGRAPSKSLPSKTMGQQHRTTVKRRRRKNYLKRKKEQAKLGGIAVKKSAAKKTAAPAKKAAKKAAKKTTAKKATKKAAKKAPAKKAAKAADEEVKDAGETPAAE